MKMMMLLQMVVWVEQVVVAVPVPVAAVVIRAVKTPAGF